MSDSAEGNGLATPPDLMDCDREPIHMPGAIQPQGALLVAGRDDLVVTQASANVPVWLGSPLRDVFGRSLAEVIGEDGAEVVRRALSDERFGFADLLPVNPPRATIPMRMIAHIVGESVCIELEAAPPHAEEGVAIRRALGVMRALHVASSQRELCDIVAAKLRQLTGYDRVMVYKFDREGHGEVIAEALERGLEPYLGLRYPASDIPRQARRMYLAQRVRTIADVDYVPVPLLADPAQAALPPLDMTLCALRSVSLVHLEYMRNMGTRASLGVSLIINNALWGMLVFHHGSPLTISADLRAQCDLIGQLVSLLLGSLGEAEAYAEQLRRQHAVQEVVTQLATSGQVLDALSARGDRLLALLNAGGAVIQIGGRALTLGNTPPAGEVQRALDVLRPASEGAPVAVDEMREILPDWSAHCRTASGALFLPLMPNAMDGIIWFRPEMERLVNWAGDPNKPAASGDAGVRLSARKSFAAWREVVRGHSDPWLEADRATAHELQRAVTIAIARQAEAELAKLRYYDVLTGLPNRRMFEERLQKQGAGPDIALLCLDLDRFKAVNDTFGHAAGDALLRMVAQRLTGCTREDDLVVRMGGDEFVILQTGERQPSRAKALARRVIRVLSQEFDIDGHKASIGVSVGIAIGRTGATSNILLRDADSALYRAKAEGRGTFRLFAP